VILLPFYNQRMELRLADISVRHVRANPWTSVTDSDQLVSGVRSESGRNLAH
jgi:hypothetical protein